MTHYFETLSKEKLRELSRKGGVARRTPELQKAWDDKQKIKSWYYEDIKTPKEIAKEYEIGIRQVYRIIAA